MRKSFSSSSSFLILLIVPFAKVRQVNCLCPSNIGTDYGVIIPLNRAKFGLFSSESELISPFEFIHEKNRTKGPSIICRGRYIFLKSGGKGQIVLTDDDIAIIRRKFPLLSFKLMLPYHPGRFIQMPVMDSVQKLRNLGYQVDVACFLPMDGNPESRCDFCTVQRPDDVVSEAEKYKIPEVVLVYPSKYGRVPKEFSKKVKGTKTATWRVFDWHIN